MINERQYNVFSENGQAIQKITIGNGLRERCIAYIKAIIDVGANQQICKEDWIRFTESVTTEEVVLVAPLFCTFEVNRWNLELAKRSVSQLNSEHYLSKLALMYEQILDYTKVDNFHLKEC
ncbi:hypothetical protein [Vibrio sp. D431a]|uniref:hypothetical protein n=1 Tax=Vibrio sp. D431a TaxID=2837388 RepID=UPI002555A2D8|nr:hypothetical protein [Vibrio sp. D431a]MDK9793267.1 hypothetical protein [Vibrio sp. D431a]